MKNLHLLPTDNKSSRLYFNVNDKEFQICEIEKTSTILKPNRHIYITSDEEIGTDEYYFHLKNNEYYNSGRIEDFDKDMKFWRKIILTTDQDLIKDGVQAIDDEFLEWFVKNPSCEEVEVNYGFFTPSGRQVDPMGILQNHSSCVWKYKIIIPRNAQQVIDEDFGGGLEMGQIIPKEEPKQETLEEAAERILWDNTGMLIENHPTITQSMIDLAKWQQQRSYSEEEVIKILYQFHYDLVNSNFDTKEEWFEQFKKK